MKKLLLAFLVLFLSSANLVFSADECTIKKEPLELSSKLYQYWQNNMRAIDELTEGGGSGRDGDKIKVLNYAFNYDGFYTLFKYFAVFPLSNSIPTEVKRDYNDYLKEIQSELISKAKEVAGSTERIADFCSNEGSTGSQCNVPKDHPIVDVVAMLMKNNEMILSIYRSIVMGDAPAETAPLLLTPEGFIEELETYYSPSAYALCYNEEKKDLKEKMDEIIKWHNKAMFGGDGERTESNITAWTNTWSTLVGKGRDGNDEYSIVTQKKLNEGKEKFIKELPNYGIYRNSQQNLLTVLDKYKQYGLFRNTNFSYNTYRGIANLFWRKFRERWDDNLTEFFSGLKEPYKSDKGYVPNSVILTAEKNSAKTTEIGERINGMYLELLNLEANSEETTSTLIQRIMKIHKDIADSVDILVDSCKLAVVMCNQQDPYNEATDCGKCN